MTTPVNQMLSDGVRLFSRTSQRGTWNIASYHDPRSLTWSWVLSFSLFRGDEHRWWPLFGAFSHGQQRWFVRIPGVGSLNYFHQRKMFPDPQP